MPLNATAASLLGFLQMGEQTGYELAKTADLVIGPFWSITRSQIYRELAGLAGAGLVETGEPGARSSQPYRLTAAGHDAFLTWVARPPAEEQIRFPLLLTLSFGRWLSRQQLGEMLAGQRQAHEARLAGYEGGADLHDPWLEAVRAFGLGYERMVLEWLDAVTPGLVQAAGAD